jgi:hypothetical protein
MPGIPPNHATLPSERFGASGDSTPDDSHLQSGDERSLFSSALDGYTSSKSSPPASPHITDETFAAHLQLVGTEPGPGHANHAFLNAPLFTSAARGHGSNGGSNGAFSQWGFVGADIHGLSIIKNRGHDLDHDPRLFCNIAAPLSVFICGSQGSGKSHTLSVLLENYLTQSTTNHLPRPLAGIVFYYDSLTSEISGSPCEASYLSSNPDIAVRVLCSRTNISNIKVRRRPHLTSTIS